MIKNMVKFFSGVIVMLAAVSAYAVTITGPGFMPVGQIDTSGIVNMTGASMANYWGGFAFVISKTPRHNAIAQCSNENPLIIKSIPGTSYYGTDVADGIYLVFYDSVITSTISQSNMSDRTSEIIYESDGRMRMGNQYPSSVCLQGGANGLVISEAGLHQVSGILKYGLYVTNKVTSGTKFNLSFYVYRAHSSIIPVNEPGDVNLINCSVATPAIIDFQNIPAGSTAPVIYDSNISINCSGSGPSTMAIKYSMKPLSETANNTSLMMKNTQNELQGDVRGFIGPDAGAEAGCTDASSSMRFNQNPITLLEGVNSTGSYSPDLKWVLCPVATPGLGDGTASAILDIIWE